MVPFEVELQADFHMAIAVYMKGSHNLFLTVMELGSVFFRALGNSLVAVDILSKRIHHGDNCYLYLMSV